MGGRSSSSSASTQYNGNSPNTFNVSMESGNPILTATNVTGSGNTVTTTDHGSVAAAERISMEAMRINESMGEGSMKAFNQAMNYAEKVSIPLGAQQTQETMKWVLAVTGLIAVAMITKGKF